MGHRLEQGLTIKVRSPRIRGASFSRIIFSVIPTICLLGFILDAGSADAGIGGVTSRAARTAQADGAVQDVMDRARRAHYDYSKDKTADVSKDNYDKALKDAEAELQGYQEQLGRQLKDMAEKISQAVGEMNDQVPNLEGYGDDFNKQLLGIVWGEAQSNKTKDIMAKTAFRRLASKALAILGIFNNLKQAWDNLNKFDRANLSADVIAALNDFINRQVVEAGVAKDMAASVQAGLDQIAAMRDKFVSETGFVPVEFDLSSAGKDVSKDDVKDEQTGDELEGVTLKFDDEEDSVDVVEEGEEIKPDGDYVVTATCHLTVRVKGKDLAKGVKLKHTPKKVWVEGGGGEDGARQKANAEFDSQGIDYKGADTKVKPVHFDLGGKKVKGYEATNASWKPAAVSSGGSGDCSSMDHTDDGGDGGGGKGGGKQGKPKGGKTSGGKSQTPTGVVTGGKAKDDPGVDVVEVDTDVDVVETDKTSKIQQSKKKSGSNWYSSAPFPNDHHFVSKGAWKQPYPDQWGLQRIGFDPDTNLRKRSLWPATAHPVIVAVIDTGVDRDHPDLFGATWINTKEIPANGKDDDNNGYVDDVHGWNFVDGNNDPSDLNGHGTVVSGIIAAGVDNGIGIAGVNPWARIMALRAMDWNGEGWSSNIADAIRYAADNGARVINISIGGNELRRREHLAVAYARDKGAIVVAASGNEGVNIDTFSPAGLLGVITVAATDLTDTRLGYSNWGAGVDIAAPGVDILSTRARLTDLLKFERESYKPGTAYVGADNRYYRVTGTSFAAPLVSGVASLILSVNPQLTGMQVTRMVMHSTRDINVPGWDQYTGYGILDARKALKADPDFYTLARIFNVRGVKRDGKTAVEISGRALADKFARAWIEAGKGKDPKQWKKISNDITKPVNRGVMALVSPKSFRGGKVWTLRLIVEHKNGFRREARFNLKLG